MKKFWIEKSDQWKNFPMAYWVHIEQDGREFYNASIFDPPAPKKNSSGTYNIYCLEFDGSVFYFSSREQYNHFRDVMSRKNLPRSLDLSRARPGSHGPNSHWLSRLSGKSKSWKYREPLIKYLSRIEKELFSEA